MTLLQRRQALRHFERASRGGHAAGAYHAAVCYLHGGTMAGGDAREGVAPQPARAAALCQRALQLNPHEARAHALLGALCARGDGVSRDAARVRAVPYRHTLHRARSNRAMAHCACLGCKANFGIAWGCAGRARQATVKDDAALAR